MNPCPPTQPQAYICLSFRFLDVKWKIMEKAVDWERSLPSAVNNSQQIFTESLRPQVPELAKQTTFLPSWS